MDAYIFSVVYIAVGLFSFAMGLKEYYQYKLLLRRGIKTRGKAQALSDGDDGIFLKVEFVDENGNPHSVFSRGGDTGWVSLDREQVEVMYERGRADEARLVVDLKMRISISTYSFGLIFTAIGVVVLVLKLSGIDVVTE